MENTTCKDDELELTIRTKRKVRFKAGADLSGKMNRVAVDLSEEMEDDQHITVISIELNFKDCTQDH